MIDQKNEPQTTSERDSDVLMVGHPGCYILDSDQSALYVLAALAEERNEVLVRTPTGWRHVPMPEHGGPMWLECDGRIMSGSPGELMPTGRKTSLVRTNIGVSCFPKKIATVFVPPEFAR